MLSDGDGCVFSPWHQSFPTALKERVHAVGLQVWRFIFNEETEQRRAEYARGSQHLANSLCQNVTFSGLQCFSYPV